jgi:tetratricopeptide (TPR) repeat protein
MCKAGLISPKEIAQHLHAKIGVQAPKLAGISFISIGLELDLTLEELFSLFERAWISGPRRDERESLRLFLGEVTDRQRLVIHAPEHSHHPALPLDWLLSDLDRLPNLILALTTCSDTGLEDLHHQAAPLRLSLTCYAPKEMPTLFAEAFGEHRFPSELGEALCRTTEGHPGTIAIRTCDLERNGAIYPDSEGVWRMPPEGVKAEGCVRALEISLYKPVEDVLTRLRDQGQSQLANHLLQFLELASLCGPNIPVQLLSNYLSYSNDELDQLIDLIDQEFVGTQKFPLFRDLDYTHRGFPGMAVYAFANPILRWVLLSRVDERRRAEVASAFYAHLHQVLPVRTRGIAILYISVLEHTPHDVARRALESELAWWVGIEDAGALQKYLTQRLKHRVLDPEVLWLAVERTRQRWPAYRSLALLEAYADQPDGMPVDRRTDWFIRSGSLLLDLGHFKKAWERAQEGLETCEPNTHLQGALLEVLGLAETTMGRLEDAEVHLSRTLGIREKALGPDHPDVATALNNLAELYHSQGRYAEAEPLLQRSLGIREKALGPDHPDVAGSLNNLAGLYDAQGRYAEAEPLLQRSLGIREKALGPDHPRVAVSLNGLADLYRAQGRYTEAEPLFQRALGIVEKTLGPDHSDVATALNGLAELYRAQGRYGEAEPLYRRSLGIREKALGPDHPDVAQSLHNLADLYRAQGRYTEAEPLFQRALGIWEKALGPDHPSLAVVMENYSAVLTKLGRDQEAAQWAAKAQAIRARQAREE